MSERTIIHLHRDTTSSTIYSDDTQQSAKPNRETPRIMIVEDDALNLRMLGDIVKSLGYDIIPTRSGKQALDLAFLHLPNLILLDIHLPDISGIQVCKALREKPAFKGTPIIAVTALARAEDRQKALSAGCTEYLVKPVSLDTLLRSISSNLELPSQSEIF